MKKLQDYYLANNDIKKRVSEDPMKPNNKVANAYPSYITDTLVGYFVGKPITYACENENVLSYITQNFEYNDESDENMELAKSASIYGVAYERVYVDEDGIVRFKCLPTIGCVPIYDTTLENNLLYFIRFYEDYNVVTDSKYFTIEVIDDKEIRTYTSEWTLSNLISIDRQPHYFKMVPVAIYKNNEEETGDFERVIDLIDAYDQMESDTLNDFEYFTDAYLALYGFTAEPEDIVKMKKNRVILMDEGTSAEWLIKDAPDVGTENMKNRLDNDIHKFSFCPNMSDENFASNASGIAIKFKTMGTENLVSIKERKFKRGLQQRLELISAIANIFGSNFTWEDIQIIFTRNLPTNDVDIASMVNSLKDIVSRETLLAQIPFIDDIEAEMEKIDKEKEENPFYQSIAGYAGMRAQGVEQNGFENSSNESA